MRHPAENDLALLAGGESGRVRGFLLERHLRNCENCQEKVAEFQDLRRDLSGTEGPDVNWNFLAPEMRANIRVGLEAGACVGTVRVARGWTPRFSMALTALLVLVGVSFFLTDSGMHPIMHRAQTAAAPAAVLQASGSGIEVRSGADSLAFPGVEGAKPDHTVSAQGILEARYINGETGSVTINNVYLQQ